LSDLSILSESISYIPTNAFVIDNISVMTDIQDSENHITSRVDVENTPQKTVCRILTTASTLNKGYLVISLRPFNPEGVSFIHEIASTQTGWIINNKGGY